MQGLVTIDFGNSHPHAGIFQKLGSRWSLIKVVPFKELQLFLIQLFMNPSNTSIVLCDVKPREEEIEGLVEQGFLITRLKQYWKGQRFAGMPVHYANTLGEDRLVEAFYCYKKDKTPTLLIDAGTFVTMDVINADGFMGGYIIPGTEAYFESYLKGEQLKDVDLVPYSNQKLPQKTADAMAGSYQAFAALAKQLIQEHDLKKVVLTGGKGAFWEVFFTFKSGTVVVESEPHLIHLALQYWMTTQIEPL